MLPYNKPFLPLNGQLSLLKQRGLQVADDAQAIACLHRNGYYRLSAYWYPCRELIAVNPPQRGDKFLDDSHFEDAVALYFFDKKFKFLLLDAIERVEIAVRVEIGLLLGARDPFALTNPALFHPNFVAGSNSPYQRWTAKFEQAVMRSKDEFILHYEITYGARLPLPVWIAIELWDFGLLSHLFSGMRDQDCQAVATGFAVPQRRLMKSWLRSLNYARNVIAHHGRLWNLNLSDRPSLPGHGVMPEFDALLPLQNVNARIYSICCILCHFSRVIDPKSSWPHQLAELVTKFPVTPHVSIQDMGFPADWQNHSFWK